MKNKIIALIVLLILVVLGGYYYVGSKKSADTLVTPEQALVEAANTIPATPEEEILQTEQVEASIDAEVNQLENTTF